MLTAKEVKERLTLKQIFILMEDLGADYIESRNPNEVQFRTICHGGDSHKLYFYLDSKNFHCYTGCGSMDILKVLQNALGINLVKAIEYIAMRFGMSDTFKVGYGNEETAIEGDDWSLMSSFKMRTTIEEKPQEIRIIEEKVLNHFYKMAHRSFLDDGININTIAKFCIMYDIYNDRIIIPHRNENGELIAIRCRNLDEELVNTGRKYMPIIMDNKILSAPTGQYFFGLFHNKDNIKRFKRAILFESEKAVLQLDTMYPETNISLALSSSNLSKFQIEILKSLGVEEVIVGLDKEFDIVGSDEEILYQKRIMKTILNRLKAEGFMVTVLWDNFNILDRKDSPTDKGKEIFDKLLSNRFVYEITGG
ncbi:MAG: hypothetical protein ACRCX2_35780 [Paraclostridium sp.]